MNEQIPKKKSEKRIVSKEAIQAERKERSRGKAENAGNQRMRKYLVR